MDFTEHRMAKELRVVRDNAAGGSVLYIDGEPFPYFTVDGFSVHPQRGQLPSVTVSIAAERVVLVDDINGDTEERPAQA